jgi:hypothetical protein
MLCMSTIKVEFSVIKWGLLWLCLYKKFILCDLAVTLIVSQSYVWMADLVMDHRKPPSFHGTLCLLEPQPLEWYK